MTAPDRAAVEAAARIRAWRQQLDGNQRAWFRRNGHPMPDPLNDPDEEVPCTLGCGTDLVAENGTKLPLLLADLDAVVDAVAEQERDEAPQLRAQRDNARAVALMLCEALREGPVGLDEAIGEHIWGKLPDWVTGDSNGRDMWGGGDA